MRAISNENESEKGRTGIVRDNNNDIGINKAKKESKININFFFRVAIYTNNIFASGVVRIISAYNMDYDSLYNYTN